MKDSNRVSGKGRSSCPFYDEIDNILGTRAASQPPTLLECGDKAAVEESDDDQIESEVLLHVEADEPRGQ